MRQLTAAFDHLTVAATVCLTDKKCVKHFAQVQPRLALDAFRYASFFHKVCDVVEDTEVDKANVKKRKTAIRFVPTVPEAEWASHCEWIYIVLCDGHVLKIGGTRTGLLNRTQSYLCGRPEFRQKGTCSTTNYIMYTSLLALLQQGHAVEVYGRQLAAQRTVVREFDLEIEIPVQTYHVYETKMMEAFREATGKYPVLSANCDKRFK